MPGTQSSFVENRLSDLTYKEQNIESNLTAQQASDFVKLICTKMSWICQSQQVVMRMAEVFRLINVSGSGSLSKMEIFRGLADNYGDMGFTEAEWESMFELMDTNQDD